MIMLMLPLMLMLMYRELCYVCCEKCTKQIRTLPVTMIRQQAVNTTAAGIQMVHTHVILTQLRHKTHCVQCMAFSPQRSSTLIAVHLESTQCAQPMCMHLQPCLYCIRLAGLTVARVPNSNPEQSYTVQCTTDCHLKMSHLFVVTLSYGCSSRIKMSQHLYK